MINQQEKMTHLRTLHAMTLTLFSIGFVLAGCNYASLSPHVAKKVKEHTKVTYYAPN